MDWPIALAFTKVISSILTAAAWPAAAAWIAYQFRAPISNAIDRLRHASALGVTVELPAPTQQEVNETPAGLLPAPSVEPEKGVALPLPLDPMLEKIDEGIAESLKQGGWPLENQLAWAIRLTSANWLAWRHENHYRAIYGSQIAALKQLNLHGPQTPDQMKCLFEIYKAEGQPSSIYNYDHWLGFLASTGDIELVTDTGSYRITDMGRAFLVWMTTAAAPEAKAF